MTVAQTKLKRISILFSDREMDILKFIMTTKGCHTFPATVRACVDGYYTLQYLNKRYMSDKGSGDVKDPVKKNKEEELTDSQYCELRCGRWNKSKQTCEFTIGSSIISVPVTDRKAIDEEFKIKVKADEFNKNRKIIMYE